MKFAELISKVELVTEGKTSLVSKINKEREESLISESNVVCYINGKKRTKKEEKEVK